jgi:hypothetical protein
LLSLLPDLLITINILGGGVSDRVLFGVMHDISTQASFSINL